MSTKSQGESFQPIPLSDLPFEDLRATEPVPEGVKREMSRRPLDVFIGDRRATPAELCAALEGSDGLELPTGFSTKLAAAPSLIDITEIDRNERISTDALPGYRPPWVDQVYHPRSVPSRKMPYLRAADGALVDPHAVIGREDRRHVSPHGYPLQCIGQVKVFYTDWLSGRNFSNTGTATLVGRRTILTAAHIMPSRGLFDAQPPILWSATFAAAHTDDLVPLVPVAHVTKAAGYWNHSVSSVDMMVMQLDRPLGDQLGYLPVYSYEDRWEDKPMWSHVGYPGSLGGISPFEQDEISVVDDEVGENESLELVSYADSTNGDSGGPLFGWLWSFRFDPPSFEVTPPEPTIIGVRSGSSSKQTFDAGGNALTRVCNYGRTHFD